MPWSWDRLARNSDHGFVEYASLYVIFSKNEMRIRERFDLGGNILHGGRNSNQIFMWEPVFSDPSRGGLI